ncbi:DUF2243 domain-containing protein [uncultured Sphingomonas sp.]|uniref:DUF2243 domain-containing protein n=1 Tax=uncultured Sphingomonas sp. TaxID=158754 RepID=UPI0035CA3E43
MIADARRAVVRAGVAIGIGMGGFVDGILFHQILQIHNMLSARIPPDTLVGAKVNMVWDGVFHAFVWGVTALGVALLWRARGGSARVPGRMFGGALLLGWGSFNLIEGVIDHHLLALHHVVERLGPSVWDWVFLVSGVALAATGWMLTRQIDS